VIDSYLRLCVYLLENLKTKSSVLGEEVYLTTPCSAKLLPEGPQLWVTVAREDQGLEANNWVD